MYLHVHVSLENNSTFFNMYIAIFTLNNVTYDFIKEIMWYKDSTSTGLSPR